MSGIPLDLPDEVTLEVGAFTQLPLPTYSGSGNVWSVQEVEGPGSTSVAIGHRPPDAVEEAAPGAPPPTPSLATQYALVTGLSEGVARWRLVLARPWQPESPTAVHELTIQVVPPTGG